MTMLFVTHVTLFVLQAESRDARSGRRTLTSWLVPTISTSESLSLMENWCCTHKSMILTIQRRRIVCPRIDRPVALLIDHAGIE